MSYTWIDMMKAKDALFKYMLLILSPAVIILMA